jgi:hypothetical protein
VDGCPRLPQRVLRDLAAVAILLVGKEPASRRRCLDKLRRHPAITALINVGTWTATLSACSPRSIRTWLTGQQAFPGEIPVKVTMPAAGLLG